MILFVNGLAKKHVHHHPITPLQTAHTQNGGSRLIFVFSPQVNLPLERYPDSNSSCCPSGSKLLRLAVPTQFQFRTETQQSPVTYSSSFDQPVLRQLAVSLSHEICRR